MDSHRARISRGLGFRDLAQPAVTGVYGEKRTPPHDSSPNLKSKYLNVLLWVAIALVAVLIGAWTIWASRQPELRSIWAPD